PDFRCTELRCLIDAGEVHRLAVDEALRQHEGAPRGDGARVEWRNLAQRGWNRYWSRRRARAIAQRQQLARGFPVGGTRLRDVAIVREILQHSTTARRPRASPDEFDTLGVGDLNHWCLARLLEQPAITAHVQQRLPWN